MLSAITEAILDLLCYLIYRKKPEYQEFQAYLSGVDNYLCHNQRRVTTALNNAITQNRLRIVASDQKRLVAEKQALELIRENQRLEAELKELRGQLH